MAHAARQDKLEALLDVATADAAFGAYGEVLEDARDRPWRTAPPAAAAIPDAAPPKRRSRSRSRRPKRSRWSMRGALVGMIAGLALVAAAIVALVGAAGRRDVVDRGSRVGRGVPVDRGSAADPPVERRGAHGARPGHRRADRDRRGTGQPRPHPPRRARRGRARRRSLRLRAPPHRRRRRRPDRRGLGRAPRADHRRLPAAGPSISIGAPPPISGGRSPRRTARSSRGPAARSSRGSASPRRGSSSSSTRGSSGRGRSPSVTEVASDPELGVRIEAVPVGPWRGCHVCWASRAGCAQAAAALIDRVRTGEGGEGDEAARLGLAQLASDATCSPRRRRADRHDPRAAPVAAGASYADRWPHVPQASRSSPRFTWAIP